MHIPPYLATYVDESWDLISGNSHSLHHGLTLAVIYVIHLRHYSNVTREELKMPENVDGKKFRAVLRRLAVWIPCNCGDPLCPCLWNFSNGTGLCRNPVWTCQVHQHLHPAENLVPSSESPGAEKLRQLHREWENQRGDPEDRQLA